MGGKVITAGSGTTSFQKVVGQEGHVRANGDRRNLPHGIRWFESFGMHGRGGRAQE
jgi:hypothetical protein